MNKSSMGSFFKRKYFRLNMLKGIEIKFIAAQVTFACALDKLACVFMFIIVADAP